MSFEKVLKLHSIGHLSDLGDTLKFGFQPNPRPLRAIIFKNVSNTEVLTKGGKKILGKLVLMKVKISSN